MQAELGGLMLKRVLLLVLLLDRAATHLAGPLRTPLLFRLGGSVKSSKQVGWWLCAVAAWWRGVLGRRMAGGR